MATNIYNFTNQRLDADKLREVQKFNSDNFGGIISMTSPISINGSTVTLNASEENPVMLMGGGSLLTQTSVKSVNIPTINDLWYLQVTLDKDSGTIIRDTLIDSNNIDKISFKQITCAYMNKNSNYTFFSVVTEAEGSPKLNEYYEYISEGVYELSQDESVQDKVYYYKIEATSFSFKFSETGSLYSYLGNSIWISNDTFIIPLCANIDGYPEEVVSVRQVQDLEGLLSAEAYAKLKKYCETTFVWSVGGQEEVTDINGNSHKKGDIGNLNITENIIDSNNKNPVIISTPAVRDINSITQDQGIVSDGMIEEFSEASPRDKLALDKAGKLYRIKDYKTPVSNGGTYLASNWDPSNPRNSAKRNLGIFYSERNPKEAPTTGYKEGDIYLWIIE